MYKCYLCENTYDDKTEMDWNSYKVEGKPTVCIYCKDTIGRVVYEELSSK